MKLGEEEKEGWDEEREQRKQRIVELTSGKVRFTPPASASQGVLSRRYLFVDGCRKLRQKKGSKGKEQNGIPVLFLFFGWVFVVRIRAQSREPTTGPA